ncbi:MAG: gamma-glutamyltransferase [Pirellulales bacterium]
MTHSNRRRFLSSSVTAVVGGAALGSISINSFAHTHGTTFTDPSPSAADEHSASHGGVLGQPDAIQAGKAILAQGGNAADAMTTAALVAAVAAVPMTGIGGYGGCAVIGGGPLASVRAIDFNTTAPQAMNPDTFHADSEGRVAGQINEYGWQSIGVPGILAGLECLAIRYGSMPLADLMQPAIRTARDGIRVTKALSTAVKANAKRLRSDPATEKLLFPGGKPLEENDVYRNPDLADMLQLIAEAGNTRPFYEGAIADKIVDRCRQGGSLLTPDDFARYRPLEPEPLSIEFGGKRLFTPPPTAGGLTVLQTLQTLKALDWNRDTSQRELMLVEALRLAWTDRLRWLGDPNQFEVPIAHLLSDEHARQSADTIREALREGKPVTAESDGRTAGGTIHLNTMDKSGLSVSLTLTHGGSFGAQVTVDGLGLILAHGLSRFDPRSGRANSPGPGKRPLHNMCPTLILEGNKVHSSVGAVGGRRIVNGVACYLAHRLAEGIDQSAAVKAARVHTEGDMKLVMDEHYGDQDTMRERGYTISHASISSLNVLERDPSGQVRAAAR